MSYQTIIELAVSTGAGFLLGLVASFLIWWLTQHYLVPEVRFAEELTKRKVPSGGHYYQCAFENIGKRLMVDVEIRVRIGIKEHLGATGWAYHEIRSNASRVPDLSHQQNNRRVVRVFDTREPIQFVDLPSLSIRQDIEACKTLEELLELGSDAAVRVHVFGFDAYSGARRHFASKSYRRHDIRNGRYKGLDVVADEKFSKYLEKQD